MKETFSSMLWSKLWMVLLHVSRQFPNPRMEYGFELWETRDKKYCILGLIFDPDSEQEVEGTECAINNTSKWVHMGLTNGAER